MLPSKWEKKHPLHVKQSLLRHKTLPLHENAPKIQNPYKSQTSYFLRRTQHKQKRKRTSGEILFNEDGQAGPILGEAIPSLQRGMTGCPISKGNY